jgi:glycopeptide antibiotics resistance protein
MNDFLLKGYEMFAVLLPFCLALTFLTKRSKQNGHKTPVSHFVFSAIFAIYIFAVFYFTGVGTLIDLLRYGQEIHMGQFNFLPFSNTVDVIAYLQNILLFIPLGFLPPLIWSNWDKIQYAFLSGLSFSLLIEISQILNQRATDVDDLLMNTTGAMLGYFAYKIIAHAAKLKPRQPVYHKKEPLILIGAMFIGHFMIYNELGLAKILYGF